MHNLKTDDEKFLKLKVRQRPNLMKINRENLDCFIIWNLPVEPNFKWPWLKENFL